MCVLDVVLNYFPLITQIFADDSAALQSVPGYFFLEFGACNLIQRSRLRST